MAAKLGVPFRPDQRYVADVGGEYDPETGMPYYREVVYTVPRQTGKTSLFLAWQINRCVSRRWSHPQRSVFTAQTGKDARDKWLDEFFPQIRNSDIRQLVAKKGKRLSINEGMGNESITFTTGSIIRLLSSSSSSGHSKTLHQAVLDEIWHDVDDRREQGLRPAMITIPDAQLLVCSTAGTQASTVLNRKVANGRRIVAEDPGSGVAYFECSAEDDWDPEDEDSYFGFMPALCPDPPCRCDPAGEWHHNVTLGALRDERINMEPGEFRRAYGNRPTAGADVIVPESIWRRVCHPEATSAAKPEGALRFGLDVAEDRASASIVACDGKTIELVEHRPGTGWCADRCNELTGLHGGQVAVDFGGPAGVLADNIESCDKMGGREVVQAVGAMYDGIVEATAVFRWDQRFDDAIGGAVKKPVGDNWVWSRKASSADVTPLMAASLAFSRGDDPPPSPRLVNLSEV